MLYIRICKGNFGSLKPGESVEGTVKAITGPIYQKLEARPYEILLNSVNQKEEDDCDDEFYSELSKSYPESARAIGKYVAPAISNQGTFNSCTFNFGVDAGALFGLITSAMTSSNLPAYADPNYWDTRYKRSNVAFDWYADYSDLSPLLRKYIPKASRVLMVGCGNAVISGEMVKDGYQEVVNTDISKVVIEEMQEKYREMPELKYMTLDVRDMNAFENESFGSIIDKGLLDALLCGRDTKQNASKMMNEIHRVLKPGGTFVLVTHDGPLSRMPYLKAPHFKWSIKLHPIPRRDSRTIKLSIEPVDVEEYENLERKISLEEAIDSNFVYACIKQNDSWEES